MSSKVPDQQQLNRELRQAASDGDIERAGDLLSTGAQPNGQDGTGWTALHWSCSYNHPTLVKMLLSHNANTNVQTTGNNTPLHNACLSGSLPCVPLLVEAGCDTEIKNVVGDKAIDRAVSRGHTDIIDYLSAHRNNQKKMDIFHSTIKIKGKCTQVLAHATFHGNARSGKTSLCSVISGKSANPYQTSTGVANKPVRIELHHSKSAVIRDDMTWIPLETLDDETLLMVEGVTTVDIAQNRESGSTVQTPTQVAVYPTTNFIPFPRSRQEICRMERMVTKALQKAGTTIKDHKNPWTLYLSDVGGQIEFQQLIPALTTGPSLHIIVMRASHGLNSLCCVEYLHNDGRCAHSYTADYTVKEELFQSLSTIMSTGTDTHLPKAMVVLTFKDDVTENEILKIDEELQKAVKGTEAFKYGVIEFASESCLCHPINNLSPDDSDILQIRQTVQRIIQNNKDYHVTIPYSWQYLSIALREVPVRVLHYDTCLQIAGECGIENKDEADGALDFLHQIGVIRHYNKVSNLRDVIITDPQLLFDNISELVINTFKFDCCQLSTVEEFKKKGIFPAEMVDRISTGSDLFTSTKFVDFLKHHHIIAPIKEHGIVTRYLLPCSLAHADTDKSTPAIDVFPPLMITFNSGYLPRGLFCFLVADLLEDRAEDEFSICLDELVIYRNQITLSVGPYQDQFKFSACTSYLRIDVFPPTVDHNKISLFAICSFIHRRVFYGLRNIMTNFNYTHNILPCIAFLCPNSSDSREPHPAVITYHNREPVALKCTLTKKAESLPEGHHIWFNKDNLNPSVGGSKKCFCLSTDNSILKVSVDLNWVRRAVWEARSQWRDIGRALDLSEGTISAIHEYDDGECLTIVIKLWMHLGKATLHTLLKALEDKSVSRYDIANEIRKWQGI